MKLEDAAERVKELRETIERHNHSYYVLDNPTISDYDYDRLLHELIDLEAEFPAPAGGRRGFKHLCAGAPRGADGVASGCV